MTSEELKIGRRGRASRVAARTAPVSEVNPCPPGQRGGQYKPLSPKQLDDIIDTAFRILDEIGMAQIPDELLEAAQKKGCKLNADGRLTFSRSMMSSIIEREKSSYFMVATPNMISRLAAIKFTLALAVPQFKPLILTAALIAVPRCATFMISPD